MAPMATRRKHLGCAVFNNQVEKLTPKIIFLCYGTGGSTAFSFPFNISTGDEPFKSICRLLGPRAKKPTLGVQHAVEAGY